MQEEMKCPTCGGDKFKFVGDNTFTCAYCGATFSNEANTKDCIKVPNKTLRIIRVGKFPLANVMLEVKANSETMGIYPFNVGFDMELPISPNMELIIQCQGINTPISLILNSDENYTCKISYSTSFSYELYNSNGVLLRKDKLGFGMWIVSFLIPIIGIIYYFVKKGDSPVKAKNALTAGLVGIFTNILLMLANF